MSRKGQKLRVSMNIVLKSTQALLQMLKKNKPNNTITLYWIRNRKINCTLSFKDPQLKLPHKFKNQAILSKHPILKVLILKLYNLHRIAFRKKAIYHFKQTKKLVIIISMISWLIIKILYCRI